MHRHTHTYIYVCTKAATYTPTKGIFDMYMFLHMNVYARMCMSVHVSIRLNNVYTNVIMYVHVVY